MSEANRAIFERTVEKRRVRNANASKQWPPNWAWPRWEPYRWKGREEPLTLADVYPREE